MSEFASQTTPEAPIVSVVVPVLNEADNVPPLVAEIAAAMGTRWPYEIVYVNDGSTDETENVLRALKLTHPNLRQVKHAAKSGQSAAVRTGARAARGLVMVTLDGDGQNDPKFLPALVEALLASDKFGLAAGQRVGRKDTGFKRWQSRMANRIRGAILRDGTRDSGCGMKAVRRQLFLELPHFDGLHRFLPALIRREGYDVAYVDVIDRPRRHGVSKYGFWDRVWVGALDLAGVWWLIRRKKSNPVATEVL